MGAGFFSGSPEYRLTISAPFMPNKSHVQGIDLVGPGPMHEALRGLNTAQLIGVRKDGLLRIPLREEEHGSLAIFPC